jgi:hypothetical protein
MPIWVTSLLFAVLVVTIPFALILKIMLRLPKAIALFHRRWPMWFMVAMIGGTTAYVMIFIRSAYYGRAETVAVLTQFLIAAFAYNFTLVLLLRQFSGMYPEFVVTTGMTGFSLKRIAYRNITDVEEVWRKHGEVCLRVFTSRGRAKLTLPAHHVPGFYERLRKIAEDGRH